MIKYTITFVSAVPDAARYKHQCDRRRKLIAHQIDTILTRSSSLAHDDPAQQGVIRTLEKLDEAYLAVDDSCE